MNEATTILKKYWGYDRFRPMQEEIIRAVTEKKDVLALLPTGGGKSVCFQVPAMMMDGICLVISPLIALMKDQVENLKKKGINALAIHSGMSFLEVRKTLQNAAFGNYKFLYVSPERLETTLFLEYLPAIKPCLVAVDESHCISQWGYDFRPPYRRIASLREQLPGVPVIALTASATREVQDDICTQLQFDDSHLRFQQSFARPNISYSVIVPPSRQTKMLEILDKVKGSSIVYCKSRKHTRHIADLLNMHGIRAAFYHAGLKHEERAARQEDWVNNRTRVMVATNAFGMGIDKPDVRTVIHYDMPDCLENYYQEAGRAGRDGMKSFAVLLINTQDTAELMKQGDIRFPPPEEIKKIYVGLMNYLQVPAGIGEGQFFPFDVADFAEKFKLNIVQASYGIQALAQEGLISYSDSFFKPSTLVFTVSKQDLFEFEKSYPALEPVIKGLLRSYEGIFDFPSSIQEKSLARFVGIPEDDLRKRLLQLHQYQVVRYEPQSDKPQVYLLQNRMYQDAYSINVKDYLARKQSYVKRIREMIAYVEDLQTCRSVRIGRYFNDQELKPCGRCDNCQRAADKRIGLDKEKFKNLHDQIKSTLLQNKLRAADLDHALHSCGTSTERWAVLHFLASEELIETDKEGFIHWRG